VQPEHRTVRGLQRLHPTRFGQTPRAGCLLWGCHCKPWPKRRTHPFPLCRQAAIPFLLPTNSATDPKKVCPVKFVMPCSSGTAALHIAVAAAGIGPGDEVITSPITDIGTVIGVIYQQGVPVFGDLGGST